MGGEGERCTIFCPPGPLPLRYDSLRSLSGGGLGREGMDFCRIGGVLLRKRDGWGREVVVMRARRRRHCMVATGAGLG